jgi:Family of unknown function (DUF6519)
MNGDFSRLTFDPSKHYSSVLLQQGRVQLDADGNEQASLGLRYLRAFIADIIGPHGGIVDSFKVIPIAGGNNEIADLEIGTGHYYVDGILCENDADSTTYLHQPDLFPNEHDYPLPNKLPFLVYLRVFERLITAVQDPQIREVALGDNGPDTAARSQVVWQVLASTTIPGTNTEVDNETNPNGVRDIWITNPTKAARLKARGRQPSTQDLDPCITSPEARYRGAENQLYRVQIHTGGTAGTAGGTGGTATFKWSRDNGSPVFPITKINDAEVTVTTLGRDVRLGLAVGDWVEIVDDRSPLRPEPDPLQRVKSIRQEDLLVELETAPSAVTGSDPDFHPFLRRWDQRQPEAAASGPALAADNALAVVEADGDRFIDLEDGIQIQFQPGGSYLRDDFWLIPARTATGDIEWPTTAGNPDARPPDGVDEHFAPLALVKGGGTADSIRLVFDHLAHA